MQPQKRKGHVITNLSKFSTYQPIERKTHKKLSRNQTTPEKGKLRQTQSTHLNKNLEAKGFPAATEAAAADAATVAENNPYECRAWPETLGFFLRRSNKSAIPAILQSSPRSSKALRRYPF